jgi:hypothetical protein
MIKQDDTNEIEVKQEGTDVIVKRTMTPMTAI